MLKNIFILCLIFILTAGCTGKHENRRGIVLLPSDIRSAGTEYVVSVLSDNDLNMLGIHTNTFSPDPAGGNEDLNALKRFIEGEEGRKLAGECRKHNIDLEFESHALEEILPRDLFESHPEYFRMDENGNRQKDLNMCFHSDGAYTEIEKSISEMLKWMKPTSHRYFFWTDDQTGAFCHCELCREYSESEQALIYENRLLGILRNYDENANLSHLAYLNTIKAPVKVKPIDGIFLEFAPIMRNYENPLSPEQKIELENNLKVFPANSAHVLEYWLDASMNSGWDRGNLTKVPWNSDQCRRDVEYYTSLGIKSVTCFATWMVNADYIQKYGKDQLQDALSQYGAVLRTLLP